MELGAMVFAFGSQACLPCTALKKKQEKYEWRKKRVAKLYARGSLFISSSLGGSYASPYACLLSGDF